MSVQCILNNNNNKLKELKRREKCSLGKLAKIAKKLVRPFGPDDGSVWMTSTFRDERRVTHLTYATCVSENMLIYSARSTKRRSLRNKRALGTPGVDWRVRRGRPQWCGTHAAPCPSITAQISATPVHKSISPFPRIRPIGVHESPPIASRGRHRSRIKIFDFS